MSLFFFTYRIILSLKDKRFKLIQANVKKMKKTHRSEAEIPEFWNIGTTSQGVPKFPSFFPEYICLNDVIARARA